MLERMKTIFGALMFVAAGAVLAQQVTAPDALVKTTVDEVLTVIKQSTDKRALNDLVDKKIVTHFDFQAMTRLAVGRYWREATPAQQKALEGAFRTLLVTTYTTALASAGKANHSVDVRPLQVKPADDDVTVRTLVRESGAKPIEISYRMAKAASGWKVYDVVVENLSLVTNYRDSFSSEIGRNGIDGLIKSIEGKNKQNAAG